MLIDTHCHLDFAAFDKDRSDVLERAKDSSVGRIINIGSSLEGSKKSLELAAQHDFIYAAVGCHPHEADRFNQETLKSLKALIKNEKVVAIGEIGLDYFKNYSKKENQKSLFSTLLSLAKEAGLPVVIHSREAENDILKALKANPPKRAVVHCFSGNEDFLNQCLELGFFVSFTCNITYKNAHSLRNLVKIVPLERLFLETDAPFLPPQEFRGKRNEPMYLTHLRDEIARIKGFDAFKVEEITTQNANKFFNLR